MDREPITLLGSIIGVLVVCYALMTNPTLHKHALDVALHEYKVSPNHLISEGDWCVLNDEAQGLIGQNNSKHRYTDEDWKILHTDGVLHGV